MIDEMIDYYCTNPDFKDYVDKYARDKRISVDEALRHELVRQTYLYYREKEGTT